MLKARLEPEAVFGRCLAATEPVQRGDLLVEELPFAFGPKKDSGIVCLGCHQYLQFGEDGDSLDRCELCDWPLCGVCAGGDDDGIHHRSECVVFSAARVTFAGNVSEDGVCTQLDCITPLSRKVKRESRRAAKPQQPQAHRTSKKSSTQRLLATIRRKWHSVSREI